MGYQPVFECYVKGENQYTTRCDCFERRGTFSYLNIRTIAVRADFETAYALLHHAQP